MLPTNVALGTFRKFLVVFSTTKKSAIPPLLIGLEVLSSTSDEEKMFAKNISKTSNLNDSGIYLPVFFLELVRNCIIFL